MQMHENKFYCTIKWVKSGLSIVCLLSHKKFKVHILWIWICQYKKLKQTCRINNASFFKTKNNKTACNKFTKQWNKMLVHHWILCEQLLWVENDCAPSMTFPSESVLHALMTALFTEYNSKQNSLLRSWMLRIWMFSSGIMPFGSLS